ncbi:hypothetical protein BDV19DRAFT_375989 [Aspergillus venezuelensis]
MAIAGHEIDLVSQGTAYGLLIGLGVLFCGVILIAIKVQKAYLSEDSANSEMFMIANRSVGTGLTASAVFSSWMWINETVLCAAMCYRYGLAVPLWWGSGLCFQIALMAALGVMAKIRVPYAHTSLEIIRMRYGTIGHLVFIVLNLTNNVFGCASMILTGSQLVSGISHMHFIAATILIPLRVVLYTAVGVLTNEHIGGLGGLYDKVIATASENYIDGNYQGSLLTMKSKDAIIWGLILKFGNLALVVMDTAFWQKSFASEVNSTVPAYNLAAVAVFGIPWGLGTVLGLSARALHQTPIFPTYPGDITTTEVSTGLVMPYLVEALIGKGGMIAFFVLLFMALTSTVSSSMIAVSSILSFDVYKTYFNPKATDKKLLKASHITVVFHAVFITGISIALSYGGANMTWIGYFQPILSSPGIIPLGLTLFWPGQTKAAVIVAPVLCFFTGLAIWLGTAHALYGEVNMTTTGEGLPALYGAIGSFFSPALYSVIISLYKPYEFDWRVFLRIELADEAQIHGDDRPTIVEANTDSEKHNPGTETPKSDSDTSISATQTADPEHTGAHDKPIPKASATRKPPSELSLDDIRHPFDEKTLSELNRWMKIAWVMFIVLVLVTFVAWPMPLYRDYIFTKSFFSGWVSVAIVWQFFALEIEKGVMEMWKSTKEFLGRKRAAP